MKASLLVFVILFTSFFAQAQGKNRAPAPSEVSQFQLSADRAFQFDLKNAGVARLVQGTFANGETISLRSGGAALTIRRYAKHITIAVLSDGSRQGELVVLEEINSLFIAVTSSPMRGEAKTLVHAADRMMQMATTAENGDTSAGLQKIAEVFRKDPRTTLQTYLRALVGVPTAGPVAVAKRNKLDTVRSFEELEGLPSPKLRSTQPRVKKKKPVTVRPAVSAPPEADMLRSYRTAPAPRGEPLRIFHFN